MRSEFYRSDEETGWWRLAEPAKERLMALEGAPVTEVRNVISGLGGYGFGYSAIDTRDCTSVSERSVSTKLIYGCKRASCPARIRLTVVESKVAEIAVDWLHNHRPSVQGPTRYTCGHCGASGHTKAACGTLFAKTVFRDMLMVAKRSQDILGEIQSLRKTGWKLLDLSTQQASHLAALLDETDEIQMRSFFYYGPNDQGGRYAKRVIYNRIFKRPGSDPNTALQFILTAHERKSYDALASMIYAMIWYIHLKASESLQEIQSKLPEYIAKLQLHIADIRRSDHSPESHIYKSAIEHGILTLQGLADVVQIPGDLAYLLTMDQITEFSQSLMPRFAHTLVVHHDVPTVLPKCVKYAWCLKEITVARHQLNLCPDILYNLGHPVMIRPPATGSSA